MSEHIKQIGYSPWVKTYADGSQTLIQIFTDLETGLIDAVQMASRPDISATWGLPTRFEKA